MRAIYFFLRVFLINFQGTREISSIYRGIRSLPCSLYSNSTVFIYRYLRMSPERFDALLCMVEPSIGKNRTNFREPISAAERLSLTLRFLATGESQQSLSFSYRVGKATVSKILRETSDAIYNALSPIYLSTPSTNDWIEIAKDFEEIWNLPNVIGALDGKHIRITCPPETGTQYHNYKGFFSLQFLAMCDARYCFTLESVSFPSKFSSRFSTKSGWSMRFVDDFLTTWYGFNHSIKP